MRDPAEHTPAPWFLEGNTVYALTTDERGREVNIFWATLSGTRFTPDGRENRANARLIAAAPDLLAALEAMVDRWEPDSAGSDRRMWETACAAIAKARGS